MTLDDLHCHGSGLRRTGVLAVVSLVVVSGLLSAATAGVATEAAGAVVNATPVQASTDVPIFSVVEQPYSHHESHPTGLVITTRQAIAWPIDGDRCLNRMNWCDIRFNMTIRNAANHIIDNIAINFYKVDPHWHSVDVFWRVVQQTHHHYLFFFHVSAHAICGGPDEHGEFVDCLITDHALNVEKRGGSFKQQYGGVNQQGLWVALGLQFGAICPHCNRKERRPSIKGRTQKARCRAHVDQCIYLT